MKRSIIHICSTVCVFLAGTILPVYSATPVWTCAIEGEVVWQHTAAVGYLIACTKTGLTGIDAEKGTVVWNNKDFAGLKEDDLTELAGTPYFMAVQKGETAIVDGFTGTRVFSAKAEGFSSITKRYPMYQCGGLLVIGKKGKADAAIMMNMNNGAKRWELGGTDHVFAAFEIDRNSVLLATALYLFRLDAATGREIWKTAASHDVEGLDKMGALGGLLKGMANKMADKNPVTDIEIAVNAGSNEFFVAVESKSACENSGGGKKWTTYSVGSTYNGYKLSDGSILWKKPYEYAGKLATMMLSDEGLILFNVGTPKELTSMGMMMGSTNDAVYYDYPGNTINIIGYQDGTPKWGKNGNGLSLKKPAIKVFKNERGIVCVTDNAVNILDPKAGALLFEKDVKIFSDIQDVRILPCGLFVCSDEKANILDLATKEVLWEKPVKTVPGMYEVKDNSLYIYSTKEKKVFRADLAARAALALLSAEEIAFEGKEKPQKLEIRPGGVLLSSDQNMQLLSFDGKSAFKAYFPAPRESALLRALNYANAARAAYYGARYGMASIQLKDAAEKTDNAVGKGMLGAFGEMTGQISNAAMGAASESFKKANERFKATSQTREYVFVLTKADDACSLLQVSKNDGKVIASIDLGSDKKPVYSVDDVAGKIYYRSEPKKIVCYAF
jgi:outer membrane protein assembly factor BamB